MDLVNGLHLRWGIGYALPDRRMTISYVMNTMGADILGSPRGAAYTTAIYRALGVGDSS